MSQRAVESLLGRLLTDVDFRRWFRDDPAAACARESLDVTAREIEALSMVPEPDFERLARCLDLRIVRASLARTLPGARKTRAGAAALAAKARAAK